MRALGNHKRLMSVSGMFEVSYPFDISQDSHKAKSKSIIPLENGIQVKRMGMDPGFHRGDDEAGMTEGGNDKG